MKYFDGDPKGTKLECCAILYKGVCYIIAAPADHEDVKKYIEHWLHEKYDESAGELGFMTERNEFLTLNEGIDFAFSKGLINDESCF